MRRSWAISVIAFSVCTYLLCFLAMLMVNIHLSRGVSKTTRWELSSGHQTWKSDSRKLAVVVPTHDGDVSRAFVSMGKWPHECSAVTLSHVDLILYHATVADKEKLRAGLPNHVTACFRNTKVVIADLSPEENVYPIGPSVQFYRMFLDPVVREDLEDYDALAIIEWDVVVAHPSSFHRLHEAAFTNSEPFWVKGSTLAGTEFHETAVMSDMWFILGHLNGNAIYNNTDPAFAEFVEYSLKRWKYEYPYDVALWASLSDFPYSWPLWQRYSQKFVATNLIANIGFKDVGDTDILHALAADTLFIHGSTKGGGSTNWARVNGRKIIDESSLSIEDCTPSCGKPDNRILRGLSGTSNVCDVTCRMNQNGDGSRFGGHLCGDNDRSKYGPACRTCYTDEKAALSADRKLGSHADTSGRHVIMCDTKRPPQAKECSEACAKQRDTICDQRCGSGHYGDLHCNWRDMGKTCRFCFHDPLAARLADVIAVSRGERVIMCDTHEPPMSSWAQDLVGDSSESSTSDDSETKNEEKESRIEEPPPAKEESEGVKDPSEIMFTEDISRGQICAFLPGYFEFLAECRLSVVSILHFMPGIPVVVPTSQLDFHAFNRTLGHLPGVTVSNSTHVDIAALVADELCGVRTRLIYYLNPGQVLSRSFSSKDTHSLTDDLIVIYTGVDSIGQEYAERAMGTTSLLGYHAPSFTYGTDLILPPDINPQLRKILLSAAAADSESGQLNEDEIDFEVIRQYMLALNTTNDFHRKSFIPEVLAATAFYNNHEGIMFVNPSEWGQHHLFESISVWNVPLVKPHFSCMVDARLVLHGYDVAAALNGWFEAFQRGAKCERGFIDIDRSMLPIKPYVEFGEAVGKPMPDIENYKVSVMYRSFYGDANLFSISLPTVIKHFPKAYEVVVVVEERDRELFRELIDPYVDSSPFPIRLRAEPSLMDGNIQQKYSKLRGDLYCKGDFILHLDSDSVLFETITYDHMFHMGKPVLPFRRYREEEEGGQRLSLCWKSGTSNTVGQEVVHEFSVFNTHVYPRAMYSGIRAFVEKRHGIRFVDFMSDRRGKCTLKENKLSTWDADEQDLLLSDFNLMGAYLWYYMHDAVHWMAIDPLDQIPGDWRRDISKYSWVCQANGRLMPTDEKGRFEYMETLTSVSSFDDCADFQVAYEFLMR